jgi:hypothetical protein
MLIFAVGGTEGAEKVFNDVLTALEFAKEINYRPTYLEMFDLSTGNRIKHWTASHPNKWDENEILIYINSYGGEDD